MRLDLTHHGRTDGGAVATIVAVLAAGGVLLGLLALSVDVGSMMFERRQLQNAADAASMAMAQVCASDPSKCNATANSGSLSALANANASDNLHALDSAGRATETNGLCGARLPAGASLPACDSASGLSDISDLTQCPALPAWLAGAASVPYVEAYARSESSSGPLLDFFIRDGGTTIVNCARAAWGPPKSGKTLPFTISYCEWDEATSGGSVFGVETSIALKYGKAAECTSTPSGGDFSGGFGNLTHAACVAETDANNWVDARTGVGAINDCGSQVKPGDTIYIPIFDCISESKTLCVPGNPSGTNTWYHIKGFAAFYITAYDVTGQFKDSLPGSPGKDARDECKDESLDNKCFYGWFVDDWVDTTGEIDPGGADLGAAVVLPAG